MAQPTLSPSKITTYLACPTKFRWTYLDDRGKWYLRAKRHYSFGTSLHRVLERFHDSNDQGVTTTFEAVAALEESWVEAGYTSQDEMCQAMAEGKELLQRHLDAAGRDAVTARTLFVEKLLRRDLGPFDLVGRMDRVDEHDDGTLEIIDYKSGRGTVSPQDVQNDIAMACYQSILRSHYPDRPVKATLVALRVNQTASYSMDDAEVDQFLHDIRVIGEEIIHKEWFEDYPVAKPLCATCDFLPLCRQAPEFELPEQASLVDLS